MLTQSEYKWAAIVVGLIPGQDTCKNQLMNAYIIDASFFFPFAPFLSLLKSVNKVNKKKIWLKAKYSTTQQSYSRVLSLVPSEALNEIFQWIIDSNNKDVETL